MSPASKEPSPAQKPAEQEDYDTRFEVVEPGFSEDQDQIHEAALESLKKAIKRGVAWKQAAADLTIADAKFKAVILDDFLKITLAERHFQGGESIKRVASLLKVPTELLVAVKNDMIREVKEASIQAYRRSESSDKA